MFLNKKIKTVIVGLGNIAWAYEKDPIVRKSDDFPTHFRVLSRHPNFYLAAAQDKNAEARNSFLGYAKNFGPIPKIYEDWEVMIKKENPDLLVVASNTESHYEICSRAIDLGVKNILCEKPISYLLKEAKKLVQKSEKSGCLLFVNYSRAFNFSYGELCEKIRRGFLGKIQSFDFKYSKGIFNNGTHALNILVRMFGEVKSARGFKNSTIKEEGADPTVSAVIKFKNGLSGYLHGLNGNFYNIFELDILGESGRIKMVSDKAEFFKVKKQSGRNILKLVSGKNLIDTQTGLYSVYENIYLYLISRDNKINRCTGRDALKLLEIADKIIKSTKYEKNIGYKRRKIGFKKAVAGSL